MNRRSVCFIALLLCTAAATCLAAGFSLRERPGNSAYSINLIVRYDDYCLEDGPCLYMRTSEAAGQEREFLEFLIREGVKANIAVTPFESQTGTRAVGDGTGARLALLKAGLTRNLFEVCLHGYNHTNHGPDFALSEFARVPLRKQKEWIEAGKRRIMDVTGSTPIVFVPPFNAWDANTVVAMKENGLWVLSAEADSFPSDNQVHSIPYTVTPKDLMILLEARALDGRKLVTLNVHPHDLPADKEHIGLKGMKQLISKLKAGEKAARFLTFREAVQEGTSYSQSDLISFSEMLHWLRFWKNLPLSGNMIRTKSVAAYRPWYSNFLLSGLAILLGISLFLLGFLVFSSLTERFNSRIFVYGLACSLFLALCVVLVRTVEYVVYEQVVAGKRYSLIMFMVGAQAGAVWRSWSMIRKGRAQQKRTC